MNQHNIDNNSSNSQAWPDFCYVDFTSKTGGWQKWRRIPIEHVAQYAKKAGNTDVFITIQRFSNPQQKDAEAHVCHLYFDLDSDLPKGDLSPVLEEAQKLVEYLNTELELPKDLGSIPHAGCGVCQMVSTPRQDFGGHFGPAFAKPCPQIGQKQLAKEG